MPPYCFARATQQEYKIWCQCFLKNLSFLLPLDPDEKIQTDPPNGVGVVPDESTETSPSVQTAAAVAEEMVKEQPAGVDSCLTAGERIGSLLQPEKICKKP